MTKASLRWTESRQRAQIFLALLFYPAVGVWLIVQARITSFPEFELFQFAPHPLHLRVLSLILYTSFFSELRAAAETDPLSSVTQSDATIAVRLSSALWQSMRTILVARLPVSFVIIVLGGLFLRIPFVNWKLLAALAASWMA